MTDPRNNIDSVIFQGRVSENKATVCIKGYIEFLKYQIGGE